MKLLRYGPVGQEKPGLLDDAGTLRDLSKVVNDITPDILHRDHLKSLAGLDTGSLPAVSGKPRIGVPISGIRKFIAIGLNYADHAAETGAAVPSEPIVFTKAISCLSGPDDDVMLPMDPRKGDWEVELGVVIGQTAQYVSEQDALGCVAGYCLVNDVSEREFQMERRLTWDKGKGFDTFGPVGPWLVTSDEIGDPQSVDLWLDLNGQRTQTGNTKTMIFGVAQLVSYVSRLFTLWPGDVITTGTPPGVGMGKKPQVFLKPGDTMYLGSSKLGTQTQKVVAFRRSSAL